MRIFKDSEGREWTLKVDVAAVKRMRDIANIDILSEDGEAFGTLATDPVALADCVYAICKKKADEREISQDDFAELFCGDSIDDATTALLDAVVDFFPKARRVILSRAIEKMREAMAEAMTEAESEIEKM